MSDRDLIRDDAWIQTFTGKRFWPINPSSDDVCIEDIAHSLALKCRYGGHSTIFYSVAEHSVHVSRALPPEQRLIGLLHDAAEAYSPFGDVPRPLKPHVPWVKAIEDRLDLAIAIAFGLSAHAFGDSAIKTIDQRILMDERALLMPAPPAPWTTDLPPLGITLAAWGPEEAERQFLAEFRRLTDVRHE